LTTGKNVGSITVYDSKNFGTTGRNPNHKYAMQPIVLKIINKDGFGDYQDGLTPTFSLKETLSTLGTLGNESEPLLSLAIAKITGSGKIANPNSGKQFITLSDSKAIDGLRNQMYLETVPDGVFNIK
jgi:carboxyl-terminal processing protease